MQIMSTLLPNSQMLLLFLCSFLLVKGKRLITMQLILGYTVQFVFFSTNGPHKVASYIQSSEKPLSALMVVKEVYSL